MSYPVPTPIYHITHLDNLPGILQAGGLHSKAKLQNPLVDVSHYDLQERRRTKAVPCTAGGTLHDYVPFYFAPRSPMLNAIHHDNVAGYSGGQNPIIYLVSSVQGVLGHRLAFAFSDGHPTMRLSRFYDEPGELARVNWNVMQSRQWNDTAEFPNRKQLRQAEFLVHQFFPWDCVQSIAVRTEATKRSVEAALTQAGHRTRVKLEPAWYFQPF